MTNTNVPNTYKLPVWKTIIDSYRITLSNLPALMRISWPWLIVLIIGIAVLNWGLWPLEQAARKADKGYSSILFILTGLVSACIGSAIAVPWHRYVLLNEKSDGTSIALHNKHVLRYFLWVAAMLAVFFMPVLAITGTTAPTNATDNDVEFILGLVLSLAVSAWWIAWMFVSPRLSLILPAIALGQSNVTLAGAWNATHKNTWRLAIATFAVLLLSLFLGIAYVYLISEPETRTGFALWNCVNEMIWMLGGMTSVTFLSLAYRHFFGPFEKLA